MTVRVFTSPVLHRRARLDADPRIGWTRCGIRYSREPQGYAYAQRAIGRPEPTDKCAGCLA
jgi:hypothetical protein